jgi:hypothetical protein
MGPELLRVKNLARKSNSFGEMDYLKGLKVLQRIFERREHGIVIYRHAAGKKWFLRLLGPLPLLFLNSDWTTTSGF